MTFVPTIIAVKEYITDVHKLLNDMEFSIAEITPIIDLEGEFSFSNAYPKAFVDLHRFENSTAKGTETT
ncbi:MAG: hypothetical protein A3F72_02550 [Bacteroidetes bacterium RIFCSPLOWO2_12_FULL_35_15]|nr:MAG: hypothetical protein A3F72_02550 [Bacteroidetes bacterium RIFCSPLOWO2_12_FULL_35_15]